MTKHTPGPWMLDTGVRGGDAYVLALENGDVVDIASVHHRVSDEQTDANARLFAAAPYLLNAAQQALDALEAVCAAPAHEVRHAPSWAITGGALVSLRAAIAKAEGAE